ncbi:transporter [Cellvibrio zantedeschiae]|uniref:Transporter n=2 Tax=Cellvibrio zantedeschiae TaxID=1237077 RepID=A0ABQ3AWV1_9GAMM|nr:transporter [Cellvibrio zantedeschiae]
MGNVSFLKNVPPIPPAQTQPRILTIDVLRGFALFGILYAHMIFWYSGGPLPEYVYTAYMDIPNGIATAFNFLFFNAKFFSLFSFLFGLSFYIQIKGLTAKHENAVVRFAWRLFILGVIGVIHHLFWRADILTIYVPLGFLLLFARNLSNKTTAILAAILILNLPTKVIEAISIIVQGKPEFIADNFVENGAKYYAAITQGTFADVVAHNIYAIQEKIDYQLSSGRFLITFGFFLLGMLAGRLKWFEDIEASQPFFKKVWKKSGLTIIAVALASIAFGIAVNVLAVDVKNAPWVRWIGGSLVDVFNASVTIFYIACISLLMLKPKWHARLAPLSHIGKMALTSYLTQSLFGVILFFHFGLGLFFITSPSMNALLCFIVFGVQIAFCKLWLQHFNYGPVEWLWRSATYLKWQPLQKKQNQELPQQA